MILGLILLSSMTATIFLQQFEILFILAIILVAALVLIRILNLSFVRIQHENNKLMIRFYSLFAVDRNYESIEFPVASLPML